MKAFRIQARQVLLTILALFVVLPVSTGAAAIDTRPLVGTRYALELDGAVVGWLNHASGGNAVGEVATEFLGDVPKKHLVGVKYEDIVLTVNAAIPGPLLNWIKSSMNGEFQFKNGAVITVDGNGKVSSRMTFANAVISEVTFPAMDAVSKEPVEIIVKLRAESIKRMVSGGAVVKVPEQGKSTPKLVASNFRLKIDGLDKTANRAIRVEALTIKVNVEQDRYGIYRDPIVHASRVEYPDLTFTTAEAFSQPLYDWLDDFVIGGNNEDGKERSGTLEYLSPDLKAPILTLNFSHIGLVKASPVEDDGQDVLRRVRADMYVEKITLK